MFSIHSPALLYNWHSLPTTSDILRVTVMTINCITVVRFRCHRGEIQQEIITFTGLLEIGMTERNVVIIYYTCT